MTKAPFLIVIDTEGDDVWSRPRKVETKNAAFLPRFQALCERHQLRPTYLVNHEMATSPVFQAFAKDVIARGAGEIGMHLHPWDSPPLERTLGDEDWFDQPYPCEYPADVLDVKVVHITRLLEDVFQVPIVSHRAGRFGFSANYCRSLLRLGYKVDCSVTPYVTWRKHPGFSGGEGGPDYSAFPDDAYWLDPDNISRPGASGLLEAPMTIVKGKRPRHREIFRRLVGRKDPRYVWLRPDGRNLDDLLFVLGDAVAKRRSYVQFTLHSSEFMPGGSPTFRTSDDIERLYDHMETLFETARPHFFGQTLGAFAHDRIAARAGASS